MYNKVNLDEKIIEVVYVSCDASEEDFKNNYALMPWAAFRYGDEHIKKLRAKYAVKAIPYLVILDPVNNCEVISIRGRKEVQDQPNDCLDLWLERQKDEKYTDPVPDLPISITTTDEAKEALQKYAEWEAERKREKDEERERDERHEKYGVN